MKVSKQNKRGKPNQTNKRYKPVIMSILVMIGVISLLKGSEITYRVDKVTKMSLNNDEHYTYTDYKNYDTYPLNEETSIDTRTLSVNTTSPFRVPPREGYIPTIFVHGFTGNASSFNTLLENLRGSLIGRYERAITINDKGYLEDTILTDGSIIMLPFITVQFDNNTATLDKQTQWLAEAINQVKKDYNVDKVNIVAHSQGGVTAINYIETSYTKGKDIANLVTLDSPILGANTLFLKTITTAINASAPFMKDESLIEKTHELFQTPAYLELKGKHYEELVSKYRNKYPSYVRTLSVSFFGSEIVKEDSAFGLKKYNSNKKQDNITYKVLKTKDKDKRSYLEKVYHEVKLGKKIEDVRYMDLSRHCTTLDSDELRLLLEDFLYQDQKDYVKDYFKRVTKKVNSTKR